MDDHWVRAPYGDDQVEAINRYQNAGMFHPLTCGNNRGDLSHRAYAAEHKQFDWGILVATPEGMVCPVCGYKQEGIPAVVLDMAKRAPQEGDDSDG